MNAPKPPVLGVVGGIAAGKTTAARILERWGAAVVDADRIARRVLELPEVQKKLQKEFGDNILGPDGSIRPSALGRLAFGQEGGVQRMNSIMHPPILERMERQVTDLRERAEVPLIAVDAPLLMEKKLDTRYCDAVLFVDAPRQDRLQRVRNERGWTKDELDRREQNQMDPAQKKQRADYVVRNDGPGGELKKALARVWQQLTGGPPPETDRSQ